jgi:hypothetical protein
VTSLQLSGSAGSLLPGATAQLTATASLSNGSTQEVTGQAAWQSTNAAVATVSSGGLVTAVAAGSAEIRASYQTVTGSVPLEVKALPAQRFAICGTVTAGGAPVPRAFVEIRDGLNAGRNVESDDQGGYCLRDLAPDSFTMRAGKTGYDYVERGITLTADTTENFLLPLQQGTLNLCGTVAEVSGSTVSGVLLEIRNGLNAGRTTMSDGSGHYCLANLRADSFSVRASRASYDAAERAIALSGDATLNFTLLVTTPTVLIRGYTATPSPITIAIGQRVRFVNNDVVTIDIASDPHPTHTNCPEINGPVIAPGASRDTAVFTSAKTCGYHDHISLRAAGQIIVR